MTIGSGNLFCARIANTESHAMMVNTIVKKISEHLNRLYIARIGSVLMENESDFLFATLIHNSY